MRRRDSEKQNREEIVSVNRSPFFLLVIWILLTFDFDFQCPRNGDGDGNREDETMDQRTAFQSR